LRGADLRHANLRGADLSDAHLQKARLHGADLREAKLCRADLQGADLSHADVRGADLSGANVKKALLDQAPCGEANTSTKDLRAVDDDTLLGVVLQKRGRKEMGREWSSQPFLDCHSKQFGDQRNLASHIPFVHPL
jgi:hypothetical protein